MFDHKEEKLEVLLLKRILDIEERQLHELRRIRHELQPPIPTQIHSSFGGIMPVTLAVGQTVVQTLTESNSAGPVAVVPANLTDVSSDPAVATVVDNNDGTFTWTGVAPGTTTSDFADTVFNLSGTDTLTVTAAPPTAIASAFGTPQ